MLIDQSKVDSKTMKLLNYKSKCVEDSGLDINSCLQFLLELYSQWTKPEVSSSQEYLNQNCILTTSIPKL